VSVCVHTRACAFVFALDCARLCVRDYVCDEKDVY